MFELEEAELEGFEVEMFGRFDTKIGFVYTTTEGIMTKDLSFVRKRT